MAGKIPQSFIDDMLARLDIVAVIDAKIPLKKQGSNYAACCPFHNEKTPSFSVSPDKQFYYCFGCGASGNAVSFLMEYDRLDFVDAIETLAQELGLDVPREDGGKQQGPNLQPHFDIMAKVNQFYQQQLKSHAQKQRPIDYLKARGLTGEVAKQFMLGYASPEWSALSEALATSPQDTDLLKQNGLVIEKENKRYDRFRDRIMFPIRDHRGRVIAFGGRILDQGEPKYLNSPETPVFHKSRTLYGLYEARQANRRLDSVLVVEGYMDVIALAQYGIQNAVATLGTATTADHIRALFRYTSEIIFCFDGDKAGRSAAWRALENSLGQIRDGKQLKFHFLPDGHDPDSLVRELGTEGFKQQLQQALPLSSFLFQQLQQQCDMTSLDGKAKLVHLAKPLIDKVQDRVMQTLLNQSLTERTGMENNEQQASTYIQRQNKPRIQRQALDASITPTRLAIALLLHHPQLANKIEDFTWLAQSTQAGTPLLLQLLQVFQAEPNLTTGMLLERWREDDNGRHLNKLLGWPHSVADENAESVFQDCLHKLHAFHQEKRLDELLERTKTSKLTSDELTEMQNLLHRK